jgi:hypothetical protein
LFGEQPPNDTADLRLGAARAAEGCLRHQDMRDTVEHHNG